jgi:hypothetical protein
MEVKADSRMTVIQLIADNVGITWEMLPEWGRIYLVLQQRLFWQLVLGNYVIKDMGEEE